jgi:hypothetical protein
MFRPVLELAVQLEDFRGRHAGEDVWVVGSDPTVKLFGPDFFDGRTVVGINFAAKLIPVTYMVTKSDGESSHHNDAILGAQHPAMTVIASQHEQGWYREPRVDIPNAVLFEHHDNPAEGFDPARHVPTEPGWLLVSQSTSGSALHFAAFLGARTVFTVGIHGGRFGERSHSDGYYETDQANLHDLTYRIAAAQVPGICRKLTELYGTRFVTVLPWGNLACDGTSFRADYGTLN